MLFDLSVLRGAYSVMDYDTIRNTKFAFRENGIQILTSRGIVPAPAVHPKLFLPFGMEFSKLSMQWQSRQNANHSR
ncbi:MAG: hypothetical protein D6681_09135 [Calditrichaeota bacterium]|nr:MAG: hypothetical protein D6681_09135 [Calditrichota bacterium]